MLVNDPIADMLTRIRNAQIAKHDTVVIPASNGVMTDKQAREAKVGGEVLAYIW